MDNKNMPNTIEHLGRDCYLYRGYRIERRRTYSGTSTGGWDIMEAQKRPKYRGFKAFSVWEVCDVREWREDCIKVIDEWLDTPLEEDCAGYAWMTYRGYRIYKTSEDGWVAVRNVEDPTGMGHTIRESGGDGKTIQSCKDIIDEWHKLKVKGE